MEILSSFTHPYAVLNLYDFLVWNTIGDILLKVQDAHKKKMNDDQINK